MMKLQSSRACDMDEYLEYPVIITPDKFWFVFQDCPGDHIGDIMNATCILVFSFNRYPERYLILFFAIHKCFVLSGE